MAKVQNTLIGRASGSVGGATFTTWKGINVLKSKPESVANPRTLGQISQRNRLAIMVPIYRLLALAIAVGFKSRAVGKSAYNAFMSANIIPATSVDGSGNATINFTSLKFALGTMGSTPIDSAEASVGSNNVQVDWDENLEPLGSNASDKAYLMAYNTGTQEWAQGNGDLRSEGSTSVEFENNAVAGQTIHLYLFFKSPNSDVVSDSVHTSVTLSLNR